MGSQSLVVNCGGTLTVRAEANKTMATVTVKISGTNPSPSEVTGYLRREAQQCRL